MLTKIQNTKYNIFHQRLSRRVPGGHKCLGLWLLPAWQQPAVGVQLIMLQLRYLLFLSYFQISKDICSPFLMNHQSMWFQMTLIDTKSGGWFTWKYGYPGYPLRARVRLIWNSGHLSCQRNQSKACADRMTLSDSALLISRPPGGNLCDLFDNYY